MKFLVVVKSAAVVRDGRIESLSVDRMEAMAEGVKGTVKARRDSFVVCDLSAVAEAESRGSGERSSLGNVAVSLAADKELENCSINARLVAIALRSLSAILESYSIVSTVIPELLAFQRNNGLWCNLFRGNGSAGSLTGSPLAFLR